MLFLEWLFGFIWRSVLKLRDYYWYCFKYILLTEERRQGDLVVEFKGRGYQRKSGIVRQMDLGRLHIQQRKWRKSWINDRNRKVLTREDVWITFCFPYVMVFCSFGFFGKNETTTELQTWYFFCELLPPKFSSHLRLSLLEKKCHFKTVSNQIFSWVFDLYCTLQ